jgi:predicted nucleic acid-binding protein
MTMKFFDSNVLIAACQESHEHHEQSFEAYSAVMDPKATCGLHSIAEIYAVATGMPAPYRIAPEEAWLFLGQVTERFQLISLNEAEYLQTIEALARSNRAGGVAYDALLLACARKSQADQILTWNIRHFRALAPDLADRIVTP